MNINYFITVKENTEPGAYVLQVSATDPDGPNNLIKYSLDIGAKVSSIYYVITFRGEGCS